ncbi:MAG: glycosyltransferase family 4 protein [Pseudonocardiaceae bacterium]
MHQRLAACCGCGTLDVRVCLVSTTYRPRTGGLETHVVTLAQALAAQGHQVTILTNRDSQTEPVRGLEDGVIVLRAGALLAGLSGQQTVPWEVALFGLLSDVEELLGAESFDVVHTHTQAALLLAALAGLHHRAPLVASFHETQPETEPCGPSRSRLIVGGLAPDLVLAGSDAFAVQAVGLGVPAARVRVVHHGLPVGAPVRPHRMQARRLLARSCAVPADGILITLVGRFKERKGQRRLVEAYQLMGTRTQVRLLLVGSCNSADVGYLDLVRADLARLGCQDRVSVLESCPDPVRDLAWAASDIATQPSTLEGLGLACVEAMFAGLPVVATDTDGLREVVSAATGLLVDTSDPRTYAQALDSLVTAPDRRAQLGAAGRARAMKAFSVERAVEQTLTVYREAAVRWRVDRAVG